MNALLGIGYVLAIGVICVFAIRAKDLNAALVLLMAGIVMSQALVDLAMLDASPKRKAVWTAFWRVSAGILAIVIAYISDIIRF